VMDVEIEPLVGIGGGFPAQLARVEGLFALEDDVDVLDAEGIATAKGGGGIVRIVDVLQHHRGIQIAQGGDAGELFKAAGSDHFAAFLLIGPDWPWRVGGHLYQLS